MYKNKAGDGGNNICGQKIREIREKLPEKRHKENWRICFKERGWTLIKMLCRG